MAEPSAQEFRRPLSVKDWLQIAALAAGFLAQWQLLDRRITRLETKLDIYVVKGYAIYSAPIKDTP